MVYSDYIYVLNKYADETKEKKNFHYILCSRIKILKPKIFFLLRTIFKNKYTYIKLVSISKLSYFDVFH